MVNIKKASFGWILSIALASGIVVAGFQAKQEKVGVVDFSKVANESLEAKKFEDQLGIAQRVRVGIIQFIQANPTIRVDDAVKLKELSLKATPTDADKAEIEKIKNAASASEARLRVIQTKEKPTQQELLELDDLNRRRGLTQQTLDKFAQEMQAEIQDKQVTGMADVRSKVRITISSVAKSQGYTLVYSTDSAVYGVNDITADCVKAAQK